MSIFVSNTGLLSNISEKNLGIMMVFLLCFISVLLCLDLTTVGVRKVYQYIELFNGVTEPYRHIRVVFIGREGAGKTTLCCRLQNIKVDLTVRQPTVGADYRPAYISIDWETKKWRYFEFLTSFPPSRMITRRLGQLKKREAGLRAGSQDASYKRPKLENKPVNTLQLIRESHDVDMASSRTRPDSVLLSLWDMGGHMAFQASHNIFISAHGVYILTFRLVDFRKDNLETDRLKKWVRLIGTFSSEDESRKLHDPPLIFVGTFLDELKKTTTEYDKELQSIKSCIVNFPEISSHKFVMFCTADNSLGQDDKELEKLRAFITEAAVHQDQWDRDLPTRWLKLEMDLLEAKEQGTRILTFEEVIKINKRSLAPLSTEEEIKLTLEYLHCTRSVIYFREFDFIINDPQWLADFFSILITDDQFLPKDDLKLTRDLDLYTRKGELTHELIDGLLSLEKNVHFRPHKSHLLALMEKFGLIARILMSGTSSENAEFSETYTIPSKLMELEDINGVIRKVSYLQQRNLFVSKTLCFVFKDVSVPDELFHRIFAQVMKTYKATSLDEPDAQDPKTTANTTCLYSGFGCFEVDDLCRIILSMHTARSTIAVTVISLTDSQLPADSGPRIRLTIERILRNMLQMSNQLHFQYEYQLHCNFHLSPYDTPVQLYGIINSERGVACKGVGCRGQHRLTKTDTIFWDIEQHLAVGEGNASVASKDVVKHSRSVNDPKGDTNISNRRPTPRELGRLSRQVDASNCESLFLHLGLPYPEIQTTKWESQSLAGITLITKMFLKWTNTYPNQTFQDIERAMTKAEMAADRISEVFESDEELQGQVDAWNRTPSDTEVKKIVTNIGSAFFNLCLELGLSPPIIEQHEMGQPVTFQERMCSLLLYWIDKYQKKATIGRLLTAMKVYGMDWYTTAQMLLL